jgi:DNA-binding transcriptional ArsR family regulator
MDPTHLERVSGLFKALADPARLRILGLLAEEPRTGLELAEELGLTPPTISHHMRRLTDAGLVDVEPHAQSRIYSLHADTLRALSRAVTPAAAAGKPAQEEDAVLRAFFDGPRLRQIPASRKKRVVVLRRLLGMFEPDRDYPEAEINTILLTVHDDYATLRRELVDYGFLSRDKGIYRVATELPDRGATVRQEVGNESDWFAGFVAAATARAVKDDGIPVQTSGRDQ